MKEIEEKIPDRDRCITTNGFNKFSSTTFVERLKQAKFATKTGIADFITNTYFSDKPKISKKSYFK